MKPPDPTPRPAHEPATPGGRSPSGPADAGAPAGRSPSQGLEGFLEAGELGELLLALGEAGAHGALRLEVPSARKPVSLYLREGYLLGVSGLRPLEDFLPGGPFPGPRVRQAFLALGGSLEELQWAVLRRASDGLLRLRELPPASFRLDLKVSPPPPHAGLRLSREALRLFFPALARPTPLSPAATVELPPYPTPGAAVWEEEP